MSKPQQRAALAASLWTTNRRTKLFIVALCALAIRISVAVFNPGFFAFDDYMSLLRLVVPAQSITSDFILAEAEIRSPLPRFALWAVTRVGLSLGLTDPLSQVRWLYAVLGCASLLIPFLAYRHFLEQKKDSWAVGAFVFLGLNAVLGFFSTRVLFESLAMLPLFASFYFFAKPKTYQTSLAGLVALALACIVRPQCGVLVLIPVIDTLRHRNRKQTLFFFLSAAAIAFAIGLADDLMRGQWFASLRYYLDYNLQHSHEYGSKPFWFYWPLALVLAPFFCFLFLPKKIYVDAFKNNLRPWIWTLTFILAHSFVRHKEERFLVPILPIFWLALSPLFSDLMQRRSSFRLGAFGVFQGLVFIAAVLSPTQWNIIGATRALGDNATLARVFHFKGALDVFPTAYSDQPLPKMQVFKQGEQLNCGDRVVVRSNDLDELSAQAPAQLAVESVFEPGLFETLFIKLNPKKNGRRSRLLILKSSKCP